MSILDPRAIASAMGGDVTGRDSCNVPGPGHGKADRSLSIKINGRAPGGFVVFSHAGDNPIKCRDYVRAALGLARWQHGRDQRMPFVVSQMRARDEKLQKKDLALRIWQQSVEPRGTIVEHYLSEHRGLSLGSDIALSVIRFHGSLWVDRDTRLPGMVCLYRDIETNNPCGIHRTFLRRDTAEKFDRKMLGIAKEAAIKFDSHEAVARHLTVGEGIETVLSARALGYSPAWAVGSSGGVKAFPVLKSLNELTLLEENDATSRRDVKECARRYVQARRPVNIITSHVGNDMNDAWMAMK